MKFADTEALCKAYLLTTPVAALVTRTDGGVSIFLGMPASSPIPAVIINRVGGGPRARKDLPEDYARMTHACWGKTRASAGEIARTLTAAYENLARYGGFSSGDARLAAAEVINVSWLPDDESDTPRFVVDALVTSLSA